MAYEYGSGLDPDVFWEAEPAGSFAVGDLFDNVPLLSRELSPITTEDEWRVVRAYLPTVIDLALLFRMTGDAWWFLPVVTATSFDVGTTFDALLEQVLEDTLVGWFALPPLDESAPPLSKPALVYLTRPTLHRPAVFDRLTIDRRARLTDWALDRLDEAFFRAMERR